MNNIYNTLIYNIIINSDIYISIEVLEKFENFEKNDKFYGEYKLSIKSFPNIVFFFSLKGDTIYKKGKKDIKIIDNNGKF